jgi:hypothetical protein
MDSLGFLKRILSNSTSIRFDDPNLFEWIASFHLTALATRGFSIPDRASFQFWLQDFLFLFWEDLSFEDDDGGATRLRLESKLREIVSRLLRKCSQLSAAEALEEVCSYLRSRGTLHLLWRYVDSKVLDAEVVRSKPDLFVKSGCESCVLTLQNDNE